MAAPSIFKTHLIEKYKRLKIKHAARARDFLLGERATTLGGSSLTIDERKEMLRAYMEVERELFGSVTKPVKHGA